MHHKIPRSSKLKIKRIKGLRYDDDVDDHPIILEQSEREKERERIKELKKQKMPKRLQELMDSRSKAKNPVKNDKKKNKSSRPGLLMFQAKEEGDSKGALRDVKKMPEKVVQAAYESSDQFIGRLERMTSNAFAEAKLSTKHNVDFCPKIMSTATSAKAKKQETDFAETYGDRKREKRRSKDIRKREKKRAKKNPVKARDFDDLKDEFEFGDVVMRPPMLQKRKKLRKE